MTACLPLIFCGKQIITQLLHLSLAAASPITCSCFSYHLQLPLLSLTAASPITCSCLSYHLQLPLLSLTATSPIT